MNRLEQALARLENELDELDLEWALIGGLAVSARAEPRTTRDIDVALVVETDREAEELVRLLSSRGYRFRERGVMEQVQTERLAAVRLESPESRGEPGIVVDLMFASSGIEPEVVTSADRIDVFPGVSASVATTGHLIALKVLAGRAQDLADLDNLLRVASDQDLGVARRAVALITRRGANRGKNLEAELNERISGDPSRP